MSRRIDQEHKILLFIVEETKPIVNQQYVVYSFKCDLCKRGVT